MRKLFTKTIILVILITLAAGCGPAAPTATPMPTATPVPPTTTPAPMTAERLVNECARAMGGVEKIKSLETMRLIQHFPDHGGLIRYEIKRPNCVRMGDELVFDGERAAWLEGELVPQGEWKDFEVDIAWYIPAFFDYPAEYMETKVVNGIETHVLQVTRPLGAVMTDNLDARTYLVYKASARFTIDNKEYHSERIYSDYRVQDSLLYPHAFTYEGRTGVFTATIKTLEFNVPLADERFAVPIASEATPTDTPAPPTAAPEPQTQSPLSGSGGGVIAFYSNRDGNTEIYTIDPDGSDLYRLTNNSTDDMAPAISPDGARIAFRSASDIYVMNIDGTERQRLTDTSVYESHPDWSPDGTQIAFVSERDGNRGIYIMDADGSDVQRLTNDPAEDMRPDWSPDGTRILFNSERDGNIEIYVMDTDGSNLRRLTDNPKWELFPQWSPNGAQIAYTLATPNQWDQEIYVMSADGTNARQLTNLPAASEDPAWSPDGTQIAFQTDRDGNFEIYVMNADGSDQRRLTNHPGGDYWPSWGPAVTPPVTAIPPTVMVIDVPLRPTVSCWLPAAMIIKSIYGVCPVDKHKG